MIGPILPSVASCPGRLMFQIGTCRRQMCLGVFETLESRRLLAAAPTLVAPNSSYAEAVLLSEQRVIQSTPEFNSFGRAVAIDGNRLLVGVPGTDASAEAAGSVHEFERSDGQWVAKETLFRAAGRARDGAGFAVALSGEHGLVYAPQLEPLFWDESATFFRRNSETGLWDEGVSRPAHDAIINGVDEPIAIDGDLAVIAESEDVLGIFEWNDLTRDWSRISQISPPADIPQSDGFGGAVAIDGGRIIVGDPLASAPDHGWGRATIFERVSGTDSWTSVVTLKSSNPAAGLTQPSTRLFGESVDISGDVAVVGATGDSDIGHELFSSGGAAFVYERDSASGEWLEVAKLFGSDERADDRFGEEVAIDGNRIVVTAKQHDNGEDNRTNSGAAYVFERTTEGTWEEVAKLQSSVRREGEFFGEDVALSGDWVAVGALEERVSPSEVRGTVYLYDLDPELPPPITTLPLDFDVYDRSQLSQTLFAEFFESGGQIQSEELSQVIVAIDQNEAASPIQLSQTSTINGITMDSSTPERLVFNGPADPRVFETLLKRIRLTIDTSVQLRHTETVTFTMVDESGQTTVLESEFTVPEVVEDEIVLLEEDSSRLTFSSPNNGVIKLWSAFLDNYNVTLSDQDQTLQTQLIRTANRLSIELGGGNDTIELADLAVKSLNGGEGIDRVRVTADGSVIDLRNNSAVTSIEIFDLTSSNGVSLLIDESVRGFSVDADLRVQYDSDDHVEVEGTWSVDEPVIEDEAVIHQLSHDGAILELVNSTGWSNPVSPTDVNRTGSTSPGDALAVINYLARFGTGELAFEHLSSRPLAYVDANGDQFISPLDALFVINELERTFAEPESILLASALKIPRADEQDGPEVTTDEDSPSLVVSGRKHSGGRLQGEHDFQAPRQIETPTAAIPEDQTIQPIDIRLELLA